MNSDRNLALGLAGAFVTVIVWSSWLVVTRYAMTSNLGVVETASIRFGVPSLIWGMLLVRKGFWPKGLSVLSGITILFGAGLGFFVLAANGFKLAPVRDSSAMMAGMLPVYTAVLGYFLLETRLSSPQLAGLIAITVGALTLAAVKIAASFGLTTVGHALFFSAAFTWGLYTIAYRRSGLDPYYAAAFICVWSFGATLLLIPFTGFSLAGVGTQELVITFIFQGIVSGVIGLVSFGMAIRHLGPPLATAITALVPVSATFGGYVFLGERPAPIEWAAIGLVALGVALASGIVRLRKS